MKISDEMLGAWAEAEDGLFAVFMKEPAESAEDYSKREARHFLSVLGPLIIEECARRAETCLASQRAGIVMQIRALKDET